MHKELAGCCHGSANHSTGTMPTSGFSSQASFTARACPSPYIVTLMTIVLGASRGEKPNYLQVFHLSGYSCDYKDPFMHAMVAKHQFAVSCTIAGPCTCVCIVPMF